MVGRSLLGKLSDRGLALVMLLSITGLHVTLGLAIKLYFFSYRG